MEAPAKNTDVTNPATTTTAADSMVTASTSTNESSTRNLPQPSPAQSTASTNTPQVAPTSHLPPPLPSRPLKLRPIYALSISLLATYKTVNEVFYRELRNQNVRGRNVQNGGYDDEHGNYIPVVGEEIAERYVVQCELGRGSFGVVLKCSDRAKMQDVALKIIRNKTQFYHQAKLEVEILSLLNERCPEDACIVKVLKVLEWKSHPVIVFELLAFSLYDLVKQTIFNGVSLGLVRKFAIQILQTLHLIHTQPHPIIHCDLKPENILLRNPRRSGIKIIDFGSACYDTKKAYQYIQSRFYRAPEVMLRLPYSTPIDLWSLGCILVELHTGLPLFPGRTEVEQLHRISKVLGPIPQHMIEPSRKQCHFTKDASTGNQWVLTTVVKEMHSEIAQTTLADILGVETGGPGGRRAGQPGHTPNDYRVFLDFVSKLLQIDPSMRSKPHDLLSHEYILNAEEPPRPAAAPGTPATPTTANATPPATTTTTTTTAPAPTPVSAPGTNTLSSGDVASINTTSATTTSASTNTV